MKSALKLATLCLTLAPLFASPWANAASPVIECVGQDETILVSPSDAKIEIQSAQSRRSMNITWYSRPQLELLSDFVRSADRAHEGDAFLLKASEGGASGESLFAFYAHIVGNSHPNMQIKVLVSKNGTVDYYACSLQ